MTFFWIMAGLSLLIVSWTTAEAIERKSIALYGAEEDKDEE